MLRAAMRARVAQAVPDFWDNQNIFLRADGAGAKIIAHSRGELGVMMFRQVLPGEFTAKTAHDLLISKGYRLKERFVDIPQEGQCDVYEKTPIQFVWEVPTIYVKFEGPEARIVVHPDGTSRSRVVHPEMFNPKTAHQLLTSKGFLLKDRFVEIEGEGACDVYENPAIQTPPASVFSWESKTIFVRSEGAASKLVSRDAGTRVEHTDSFNPKSAHELLSSKGYVVKDRFVEDDVEGLCDIYEKLEVVEASPVAGATATATGTPASPASSASASK